MFDLEKDRCRARIGLLLSVATAVVLSLALVLLLNVKAAPGGRAATRAVERDRIGLPTVGSMALQYINRLGLLEPTSTTINILASDGTIIERVAEPAAPPESMLAYSAPQRSDDLARIEYEKELGGGNLVFGIDYELLPSGNSAYLGLELAQPASLAQPVAYELHIMFLMKRYWNWGSAFVLQNRQASTSATLVVSYYDTMGSLVCGDVADIPAGGSLAIALDSVGCLPDGFYGSAVVSADQPLAVSSVQNYNLAAGLRCAYQGIGTEETAGRLVAPALFNGHDLQTSTLCIVNAQDSDTEVTVEYSDGLTFDAVLPARATWCLYQGGEGHASGWGGGASIEASQPVAAVVQVQAYEQATAVGCWAYTASPLANTLHASGDTLAFPLVAREMDGWVSEIHLYNPGPAPVQVTPRYVSYPEKTVYCLEPITIGAGDAMSLPQGELPGPFGQGMAYLVSTGPLGGAAGFTNAQSRGAGDRHFGYRAANVGSAIPLPDTCQETSTVYLPLLVK